RRKRSLSPLSWPELPELPGSDGDTDQAECRIAYRRGHAAHHAISPLGHGDLDPARREVPALPDGRRARGDIRLLQGTCLDGGGRAVREHHATLESRDGAVFEFAFHLR